MVASGRIMHERAGHQDSGTMQRYVHVSLSVRHAIKE